MIPKLHAKGKSFKGAAAYLLHDKGNASSSERVEWVDMQNLAVEDPEAAWRIMVATALDQDRLKEEAGIKNTGRKSNDHVLHLSLSWHPEETNDLDAEEMKRAANGAIKTLGASDHQAMLICHNDERQPHLHILLNRVSPEDGRMLSSSKEREKLSRWAQAYEEERGQVYCQNRVLHNAMRDLDYFPNKYRETPRHLLELENKAKALLPEEQFEKFKSQQKAKDATVGLMRRKMDTKHQEAWVDLVLEHKTKKATLTRMAHQKTKKQVEGLRQHYMPQMEALKEKHKQELAAFHVREKKLFGKIQNAVSSLDYRSAFQSKAKRPTVGEAFSSITTSDGRFLALQKKQERENRQKQLYLKRAERKISIANREKRDRSLSSEKDAYLEKRGELKSQQTEDKAKVGEAWKARHAERASDLQEHLNAMTSDKTFNEAANPAFKGEEERQAMLLKDALERAKQIQIEEGYGRDPDREQGR